MIFPGWGQAAEKRTHGHQCLSARGFAMEIAESQRGVQRENGRWMCLVHSRAPRAAQPTLASSGRMLLLGKGILPCSGAWRALALLVSPQCLGLCLPRSREVTM